MAESQSSKFAHFTYTDQQLIAELRRVDAELGATGVLSGPAYVSIGRIARQTFATRFGSWRQSVLAAGLQHPTVKGGARRVCVMCGGPYRGNNGSKASKTCGRECAAALRRQDSNSRRKPDATPQASRGRARGLVAREHGELRCAHCDRTGRIEVHHKDRDWRNGDIANLVPLCLACHGAEHRVLGPRECGECGNGFHPKRSTQLTCSKRCGGLRASRARKGRA